MFKIPKRPFKTFNDYMADVRLNNRHHKQFPCPNCDGLGRYRRAEDHDPYEGWKLADWFICPICKGTGETSKEQYKFFYNNKIKNWQEDACILRAKNQALKKLSPFEIQLLGIRTC